MPSVTQTPQAEDDLTDLFTNLGRHTRRYRAGDSSKS